MLSEFRVLLGEALLILICKGVEMDFTLSEHLLLELTYVCVQLHDSRLQLSQLLLIVDSLTDELLNELAILGGCLRNMV